MAEPVPQQPDEIPYREVDHDGANDTDDSFSPYWPSMVGHAHATIYTMNPRDEARWRKEQEERDARRIPPGF